MPVDKFGRSEDDVVTNIYSVITSVSVTLAQINNTFPRRGGTLTVAEDINNYKHKPAHLGEPSAVDDAVTRKCVDNSSQTASVAVTD
jgi:hypothetical protein